MTEAIFRETKDLPRPRVMRPWSTWDAGDWALIVAVVMFAVGLGLIGLAIAGPLVGAGVPLVVFGVALGLAALRVA